MRRSRLRLYGCCEHKSLGDELGYTFDELNDEEWSDNFKGWVTESFKENEKVKEMMQYLVDMDYTYKIIINCPENGKSRGLTLTPDEMKAIL